MDKKVLIVGYGNSLRNDDGIGPVIAEKYREYLGIENTNIETMSLPQLDIILVPKLSEVDLAIFVDVRAEDSDENLVKIEEVEVENYDIKVYHTSHTLKVNDLIKMSKKWYGSSPRTFLVMPKGVDFETGTTLSEVANNAIGLSISKIDELIAQA
jgi:hydrogenase maturation protease